MESSLSLSTSLEKQACRDWLVGQVGCWQDRNILTVIA